MTVETVLLTAALELDGEAPTEFRILRAGDNATKKGTLIFDESAAQSVLGEFSDHGVDLPIDFGHAMAGHGGPLDQIAAGWFKPSVKEGELWASDVTWTPRGSKGVTDREWRYTSLYGDVERVDDGRLRLVRLRTVSLTNTPATVGVDPLVASESTQKGPKTMDIAQLVLAAVGAKDEADAGAKVRALVDLSARLAELTGKQAADEQIAVVSALKISHEKLEKIETELSELKQKNADDKRDGLIATLTEAGKLTPAQHDWARSLTLSALEAFGETAPVVVPGKESNPTPKPNGESVELSAEDKKMAKAFGNDPEAVLAEKRRAIAANKEG